MRKLCVGYRRGEHDDRHLDYVVECTQDILDDCPILIRLAILEELEWKAKTRLMELMASTDKGTDLVAGNGMFNGDWLFPFVEVR